MFRVHDASCTLNMERAVSSKMLTFDELPGVTHQKTVMSLCFNCLLSSEVLNMYVYSISFCGCDSTSYIGTGGETRISKIGSSVRSVIWHYITTKSVLCDRRSVVRKPLQTLCMCFSDCLILTCITGKIRE